MAAYRTGLRRQHTGGAISAGDWIQSPGYDLGIFILSPLLGLAWLLTAPDEASILAVLALLGIPHYLSTFTFYFWEENRRYHRTRWTAFFVAPVGLVLTVGLLVWSRAPYILPLTVFFWNAYHVARQSCGILSIYRHRAGVFDPCQKTLANTAIIATNGCMAVWNLAWHPVLYRPLSRLVPPLPGLLWLGLGAVSLVALLRLGVSLWQRGNADHAPHVPEMCFLCTSLLLFHPYVWVQDGSQATTAMLIGHFVQYLGIVWLLQRRKCTANPGASAPSWLLSLSTHTPLLLLVALAAGGLYLLLKHLFTLLSCSGAFDTALFMLVLLHFYLDRLFWAFKEPHVRQSIGPYLMLATSARQ